MLLNLIQQQLLSKLFFLAIMIVLLLNPFNSLLPFIHLSSELPSSFHELLVFIDEVSREQLYWVEDLCLHL